MFTTPENETTWRDLVDQLTPEQEARIHCIELAVCCTSRVRVAGTLPPRCGRRSPGDVR
jgi:hypothetical protein